jgi:hypothetical protein
MTKNMPEPFDRRALKVLFDTYWSRTGWRDEKTRSTPPADFAYAQHAGLMFAPIQLSHADIVKRAESAVRGVQRQAVADAFMVSLSTRRLDLRSALGSCAVLQHFPQHVTQRQAGPCNVCGEYVRTADTVDLNVLNFERFKWGGVRHDNQKWKLASRPQTRRLTMP